MNYQEYIVRLPMEFVSPEAGATWLQEVLQYKMKQAGYLNGPVILPSEENGEEELTQIPEGYPYAVSESLYVTDNGGKMALLTDEEGATNYLMGTGRRKVWKVEVTPIEEMELYRPPYQMRPKVSNADSTPST